MTERSIEATTNLVRGATTSLVRGAKNPALEEMDSEDIMPRDVDEKGHAGEQQADLKGVYADAATQGLCGLSNVRVGVGQERLEQLAYALEIAHVEGALCAFELRQRALLRRLCVGRFGLDLAIARHGRRG